MSRKRSGVTGPAHASAAASSEASAASSSAADNDTTEKRGGGGIRDSLHNNTRVIISHQHLGYIIPAAMHYSVFEDY